MPSTFVSTAPQPSKSVTHLTSDLRPKALVQMTRQAWTQIIIQKRLKGTWGQYNNPHETQEFLNKGWPGALQLRENRETPAAAGTVHFFVVYIYGAPTVC